MYEVRREQFDKIAKRYKEYVILYRKINAGSLEGLTPFDEFYWRFTYYQKYEEAARANGLGY